MAIQRVVEVQPLYQVNPRVRSTFSLHSRIKNRSFTDSLQSYQFGAGKEAIILRKNGRIPTREIVLHFLKVLPARAIISLRTRIFRYLQRHGLEGVACIELTRGADRLPNNTVHFHILTDDPRSQKELRLLFNIACSRAGLVRGEDYRIDSRPLPNGEWYFAYFTKFGYSSEVILFCKGTGLVKFYQIGQWYCKPKKTMARMVDRLVLQRHAEQ
jgi:hypothetical protein